VQDAVELRPSIFHVAVIREIARRFVDGESRHPIGVRDRERQGDRATTGMAVEMKPLESGLVGGAEHPFRLGGNRVSGRWHVVAIDFEILEDRVDVGKMVQQRLVATRSRRDDARRKTTSCCAMITRAQPDERRVRRT
jgi:hypothetical protein